MKEKERAANNRTLTLESEEIEGLKSRLLTESNISAETDIVNRTLNQTGRTEWKTSGLR